ncbi:hypothetical protein Dfri01_59520 [Dyadobacter frigoris]|uniref:hypothetical protein n=1 Tax=Dyadobacter frigoris TaxID=2576211 RepID=UPI0024A00B38|nr:hypothetical protein [Dyadobacter frigoris]GLU56491.1 hypothetical protein Dfri01_59520 [Dyadobacter frigoris]
MKKVLFVLIGYIVISCSGSSESDSVKQNYLGEWNKVKGRPSTLTIYEENEGLFLKYGNGDKFPLKYEKEGKYYAAVTGFGNTALLIENNTLQLNGTQYQKKN